MARQPDPVKRAVLEVVTELVNEHFEEVLVGKLFGEDAPPQVAEVEIHDISISENMIRLKINGNHPRYFYVKVKEQM